MNSHSSESTPPSWLGQTWGSVGSLLVALVCPRLNAEMYENVQGTRTGVPLRVYLLVFIGLL